MMNGVTIIWWDWVRWCKGEESNHNVLLDVLLLIMPHKWSPRHPRLLWTDPTRGWHISNLSRAGVALGEFFLRLRCLTSSAGAPRWKRDSRLERQAPFAYLPLRAWFTPPPPLHNVPQTISHHPLSPLSSVHTPPPSSSFEVPMCAPLCLLSFNTCQDSWGTSYIARISFKRAPRDVIIRIIAGPYGWCYISVPSLTRSLQST